MACWSINSNGEVVYSLKLTPNTQVRPVVRVVTLQKKTGSLKRTLIALSDFSENADINASRNILAVGHTVLSVEGRRSKGRPAKQKASEIREEVA